MHYQAPPHAEAKLVRCIKGAIYDVIIDLRTSSPTFRKWFAIELSSDNRTMLFVPQNFAHGVLTLADDTELFYQMSSSYQPGYARGIRWDDPTFNIAWPDVPRVMSLKDRQHPDFKP
jgi:dTDP-4-dehydrorhamnose 3,5-epimerase